MPRGQRHVPTDVLRGQVYAYAATGMPQRNIAAKLGMNVETLARHYGAELETAQADRVHAVANSLFAVATSEGNGMSKVVASIFLLKTQGKWRETSIVEHADANGNPLQPTRSAILILPDNGRGPLPPPLRPPRIIEGDFVRTG